MGQLHPTLRAQLAERPFAAYFTGPLLNHFSGPPAASLEEARTQAYNTLSRQYDSEVWEAWIVRNDDSPGVLAGYRRQDGAITPIHEGPNDPR